jgi:hypothetical protein
MHCDQAFVLLSAQRDGELLPADRGVLDEHLAACPACREAAQALRLQDANLRQAFAPDRAAAAALAERVLARLPTAPPYPGGRARRGATLLATAAGLLILVLLFRAWQPARPEAAEKVIFLRAEAAPVAPEPEVPLELAMTADVIAVGVMGKPLPHSPERAIRLHVERVLKGDLFAQAVEAGASKPKFYCCPSDPPASPAVYQEGTRALVYLRGSAEAGWGLLDVRRLDEQVEKQQLPQIERCLEVAGACHSADPKRAYQRLLAPEAGGLDTAACTALSCSPDPQAADALLEQLEAVRARLLKGSAREDGAKFDRLVRLLVPLHEARAVRAAWTCTRRLSPESRAAFYTALPELCRSADRATLAFVRQGLLEAIRKPSDRGDEHIQAVRALGKLADSDAVTALLEEQARRPVGDAHQHVVLALRDAARALGGMDRARIHEAWLVLLSDYKPHPAPSDAERAFIRTVVDGLGGEVLTAQQKHLLHAIRESHKDGWFRQELDRLPK